MKTLVPDARRRILLSAGAGLMLAAVAGRRAGAADEIEVTMAGTTTGSHVWYRPRGLLIAPGQAVRWVNHDAGNVHTITAYHPDNNKPLRIPDAATIGCCSERLAAYWAMMPMPKMRCRKPT